MDGEGCLHALLVAGLVGGHGELGLLAAVQIAERAHDRVAPRGAGSLIGSNRRRRTISKPSSALAGRQADSSPPKVFLSRLNASRPASPPISISEAGRLATTSTRGTARAASVSAWAKVMPASNAPPGRSCLP